MFAWALLVGGVAVLSPKAVHAIVATIIRDQDNAARHPFTTNCSSSPALNFCATPPIPAGQQVVIETIAVNGFDLPPNDFVYLADVRTSVGGNFQFYSLNPIFDNQSQQPSFANVQGIQSVRLYADPGTAILCDGGSNASLAGGVVSCTFSGYFVTLP